MSDIKQTFIDPKTGEEIESSWFARVGFRMLATITSVVSMMFGYFPLGVFAFLLCLISLLVMIFLQDGARRHPIEREIHDTIARAQHRRRQKLLQRKLLDEEWAGVPKTALSLADPLTPPQPTDLSLTQADSPKDEKPRMTKAVEETTADDDQTVKSKR